ncbi:hypothetical protein B8281_04765 [Cellulosimicrobium sp. TH-20]|nr:hypothetical protein B8281_04765 [Cellulosimicrobium sp. TH-20]
MVPGSASVFRAVPGQDDTPVGVLRSVLFLFPFCQTPAPPRSQQPSGASPSSRTGARASGASSSTALPSPMSAEIAS